MPFDFHALCDLDFDDDDDIEAVDQYTADILELFHNSEAGKKYGENYQGKGSWIEPLLHYTFSHDLPALPHMNAWDIRHLLTKIFPEIVVATQDEAPEIIPEMIAFWQFIDSEFEQPDAKQILKYLRAIEKKYPKIIMDKSKFGITKTMIVSMLEEGIDLLDEKAVNAFMKRYNKSILQEDKPLTEEKPSKSLAKKQNEYTSPVVELLTLGRPEELRDWPDYLELGFTKEHVEELSRMAVDWDLHEDESDDELYWAPIYAWRILGQLKAEEALDSLMLLLGVMDEYDSDWIGEDLPEVFGMIGPSAIPHLENFLKEGGDKLWGRVLAADSLKVIGNKYYQAKVICINTLLEQLKEFFDNHEMLNAVLISSLIDLKATEALPVIEEAYGADMVDPMVCGDWEDVQIEFGILKNRNTPPPYGLSGLFPPRPEAKPKKKQEKKKVKTKQQQQSKKQNRKKKKKGKRKKK